MASEILGEHFTPQQLAQAWQLDENTIRRIFVDVPGVLRIGSARPRRGKQRGHLTLRIPAEVAERVYRERMK
ncbi:MAG TPA: hypothetical protein VMB85_16655 [Bryobacteraceae bacterium]|nr:hypothetical protein [Bryobacteraceae bacterium]